MKIEITASYLPHYHRLSVQLDNGREIFTTHHFNLTHNTLDKYNNEQTLCLKHTNRLQFTVLPRAYCVMCDDSYTVHNNEELCPSCQAYMDSLKDDARFDEMYRLREQYGEYEKDA